MQFFKQFYLSLPFPYFGEIQREKIVVWDGGECLHILVGFLGLRKKLKHIYGWMDSRWMKSLEMKEGKCQVQQDFGHSTYLSCFGYSNQAFWLDGKIFLLGVGYPATRFLKTKLFSGYKINGVNSLCYPGVPEGS